MALVWSVVSSHWPLPFIACALPSEGPISAIANGTAVVKNDTNETKMTLSLDIHARQGLFNEIDRAR